MRKDEKTKENITVMFCIFVLSIFRGGKKSCPFSDSPSPGRTIRRLMLGDEAVKEEKEGKSRMSRMSRMSPFTLLALLCQAVHNALDAYC
jgi:hypothetical protein